MRILILGHYEIASNYAISLLVDSFKNKGSYYDLRVALSGQGDQQLGKLSGDVVESKKDFSGLAQYEQQLCDDLNAGNDSLALNANGFNQIAETIGKPICLLADPNSEKGLATLKSWAPDLIISIRYRKIFRAEAIAIPNLGIINLHSGLLPEYRGVMATFWAMLNQEEVYGSTLHCITDSGIDTGAIIQRNPEKLDYKKSYLENVLRLYPDGVASIKRMLQKLSENSRIDVQMSKNKGYYYSFPKQNSLDEFYAASSKLY